MEEAAPGLGEIMRGRRHELGLSLGELAAATGIHKSLLSRIETGSVAVPGTPALGKLAQALQLPLTSLFGVLSAQIRDDLPPLQPYLRAKYDLPDQTITAITDYLTRYGGQPGPADGEDEKDDIHQIQKGGIS